MYVKERERESERVEGWREEGREERARERELQNIVCMQKES